MSEDRRVSTQSPIRYPGGKTRAISKITPYIPQGLQELVSPFFGGGSLEIALAADGVRVFGGDAYKPLARYWDATLKKPKLVADLVRQEMFPLSKDQFHALKAEGQDIKDPIRSAATYFALNRASYGGLTYSGGYSPGTPRFTEGTIKRQENFYAPNISVKYSDYEDMLNSHPNMFAYLDPPYDLEISNLYGKRGNMHKGFDHDHLAEVMRERDGWIMSYNWNDNIGRLYDKYEKVYPQWNQGLSKDKSTNEVLILNL